MSEKEITNIYNKLKCYVNTERLKDALEINGNSKRLSIKKVPLSSS